MSNTTTLTGNLTRDPELRYTNNAKPVVGFGLAVNRRYQQNGDWQEQTSFFDITAWGDLAENAALSLHKGDRVTVTGRLEQRTWEADNGDKRSKIEVVASDVAASLAHAQLQIVKLTREHATQSDSQAA